MTVLHNKFNSVEDMIGRLTTLRQDVTNMADAIIRKIQNIDEIICGLSGDHNWELNKFDINSYPLAEPPGLYTFRCSKCGAIVSIRAMDRYKAIGKGFKF